MDHNHMIVDENKHAVEFYCHFGAYLGQISSPWKTNQPVECRRCNVSLAWLNGIHNALEFSQQWPADPARADDMDFSPYLLHNCSNWNNSVHTDHKTDIENQRLVGF